MASYHAVGNYEDDRNAHFPPPQMQRTDSAGASTFDDKYGYGDSRNASQTYLGGPSEKPQYSRTANLARPPKKSRKRLFIIGGVALLVIIGVAAGVGGYFGSKKSSSSSNSSSSGTNNRSSDKYGDGAMVTADDGTTFRYNNTLGGYFRPDAFDLTAKAQADTPSLDEKWDYSTMRIYGVNLGGWLVVEPFITPGLFEPFVNTDGVDGASTVIDEYTLSSALGSNLSTYMDNHYSTFITEMDIAQIAAAGLNWIRLPVAYWQIQTYPGEPFLEGVGWKYILKTLEWCRKYGLRMELDIHALPGSQNGQNHSGFIGATNFLLGTMGIANAQRSLEYIRTLTQFITHSQYQPVVQMFAVANEVNVYGTGMDQIRAFYLEAYQLIRSITGIGEGHGPMLAIHDGFHGQSIWAGFMQGADRQALEVHNYLAFSPDLYLTGNITSDINRPCRWWTPGFNQSDAQFGLTFSGEWCLATNDCGQWINHIGAGSHFGGNFNSTATTPSGNCGDYMNWRNFSPQTKIEYQRLFSVYQDMAMNTFFWTWKTGTNSTGEKPNPLWDYQLGWQNGWIPANPRDSFGACERVADIYGLEKATPPSINFTPPFSAWMTGGAGAGTFIGANATAPYTQWPPASIVGFTATENLYTYTRTGTPMTLTMSPTSTGEVQGFANTADTARAFTPVSGCSYPNAYSGAGQPYPSTNCPPLAGPTPTPAPNPALVS